MGTSIESVLVKHGITLSDDELAHYGKKGMQWGRRKSAATAEASTAPPKPHVKTMSDTELKSAIARLKMEKEFSTLTAPQVSLGRKIVGEILLDVGKQAAKSYLNAAVGTAIAGGGIKGSLKTAAKAQGPAITKAAPAPAAH